MKLVSLDKFSNGSANQNGSVLVYVLLGIVLLGALAVALRDSGGGASHIDKEDAILKASQAQSYAREISEAVTLLLKNNLSESELRFAHPDAPADYGVITTDPDHQVFSNTGGRASYRTPPEGVNDGSNWEFFASTDIPQVGSDKSELVAVLPNVTQTFCQAINSQIGFDRATQPTDSATGTTPDCVKGLSLHRFSGNFNDSSPNVMDTASFSRLPVLQACVYCASDSTYNYYYVLMAR